MTNALQQRQQRATQALGAKLSAGDATGFMEMIKGTVLPQLPKHLADQGETYLRIVVSQLRKNPKLMECHPASLVGAIVEATQVGLRPGVLGECHLVPYSGEVTLIYGYQGYISLAHRAGVFIRPPVPVYTWEVFDYQPARIANPIIHEVNIDERPGDEHEAFAGLRAVYAIATTAGDPYPRVDPVNKKQIITTGAAKMKAARTNPWKTHPLQMALKTAVIRICKYSVKSPEMARALEVDGHSIRAHGGELEVFVDSETIDESTGEVGE
jgi:recombination protein RecT